MGQKLSQPKGKPAQQHMKPLYPFSFITLTSYFMIFSLLICLHVIVFPSIALFYIA